MISSARASTEGGIVRPSALEEWAQRHHHHARLRGGEIDLELLEAVRQDGGKLVAFSEPCAQQRVGEAVHPRVELSDREALVTDHDREYGWGESGRAW